MNLSASGQFMLKSPGAETTMPARTDAQTLSGIFTVTDTKNQKAATPKKRMTGSLGLRP
jgi:hypothetical protein